MSYFINVIDHDGKNHQLEATVGFSLMEIIRDAGLDIEAICGGCCACATCHCYLTDDWQGKVNEPNSSEADMLEMVSEPTELSRLSCQVLVSDEHHGLQVRLPESQY